MISIVLKALIHPSLDSWIRSAWLQRTFRGDRHTFFALAVAELAQLRVLLFFGAVFWMSEIWGGFPQFLSEQLESHLVIFWLGDNRLEAFLQALGLGILIYFLFRRFWPGLLFLALGFASGFIAVNWAWGFLLGLQISFWLVCLRQSRREKLSLLFQRAFQFKIFIQFSVLLSILFFSNELTWLARSLDFGQSVNHARFMQTVILIGISQILSLSLSGLVFHFYFWIFRSKS